MTPILAAFGVIDWTVLALYMVVMIVIGAAVAHRQNDATDFFLGGRTMPAWAVALSILATSLSAATFIGVPELSYGGDLTYLSLNLGGTLAAFVVAFVFVPPIYRAGTLTIYGYLGNRLDEGSMILASAAFLIGRLLASGARLFIAGIAFYTILFGTGEIQLPRLIVAIVVLGGIGTLYTVLGGIRAVIWTDVIQIVVMTGAAILSIGLLLKAIPLPLTGIMAALKDTNGIDKLRLINTEADFSKAFTIWAAWAVVFSETAAYGTDHDLAQRMLTTRSPWRASCSLIAAKLLSIPVILLFLIVGLLLSIFYGRPEIMGEAAGAEQLLDTRKVYPQFLVNHMPTGIAGLAMAGLFAAAMSSFDSAVNAMAGSFMADLYLPLKRRAGGDKGNSPPPLEMTLKTSRQVVALVGIVLIIFAIGSVFMQAAAGDNLINFALGVMTFAYAGILGVFLSAILLGRGNRHSVLGALVGGVVVVLLLQDYTLPHLTRWISGEPFKLAWPYWMLIGTTVSFLICIMGSPAASRRDPR